MHPVPTFPAAPHPRPRPLTREDLRRAINAAEIEGLAHWAACLRRLYEQTFGPLPAPAPHHQADKARRHSPAHL
jgi:hypothetical protein